MHPDVRDAILKHIIFKFSEDGSLTVTAMIPAIKQIREATGWGIAESKAELEKGIAEMVTVSFGELVARMAFRAGQASNGSRTKSTTEPAGSTASQLLEAHYSAEELGRMTRVELIRYGRTLGLDFHVLRGLAWDDLVSIVHKRQRVARVRYSPAYVPED